MVGIPVGNSSAGSHILDEFEEGRKHDIETIELPKFIPEPGPKKKMESNNAYGSDD